KMSKDIEQGFMARLTRLLGLLGQGDHDQPFGLLADADAGEDLLGPGVHGRHLARTPGRNVADLAVGGEGQPVDFTPDRDRGDLPGLVAGDVVDVDLEVPHVALPDLFLVGPDAQAVAAAADLGLVGGQFRLDAVDHLPPGHVRHLDAHQAIDLGVQPLLILAQGDRPDHAGEGDLRYGLVAGHVHDGYLFRAAHGGQVHALAVRRAEGVVGP